MLTHGLIYRQRSETSEPPVGAFGTSLPEEPTADVFTTKEPVSDSSSDVSKLDNSVAPICEASKDLKLTDKDKASEEINPSVANALPTKLPDLKLNTIRNRLYYYFEYFLFVNFFLQYRYYSAVSIIK